MSVQKLANRYADAFFNEVVSSNLLDKAYQDLSLVSKAIDESKEFASLLKNPIVDTRKKIAIVSEIFKQKVSDNVLQFLLLILNNKREAVLGDIINTFFVKYNSHKGIAEVFVTTASEIDAVAQSKIEAYIKQQSGKPNVKINKKIDESILGGFIIDFGNKILDNSVKYKLSKIRKELAS